MTTTEIRCHDCGVAEGELHHFGCDVEECPRCGLQLIGCECWPWAEYDDPQTTWIPLLEATGRIPWIHYPNLCSKCGKLWPKMFRVPDEEWAHYVAPSMRNTMLCPECYAFIKAAVRSHQ